MKTSFDPHYSINFKVKYGVAAFIHCAKKYNRVDHLKLMKK